jgi:hypothetical protein
MEVSASNRTGKSTTNCCAQTSISCCLWWLVIGHWSLVIGHLLFPTKDKGP